MCAELGHQVALAEPDYDKPAVAEATTTVIAASTLATLEQRAGALGRAPAAEDVERATWALARIGEKVSGSAYVAAVQTLHGIGRQVARFFGDHDVLLTPMLAQPPIAIGVLDMMTEDLDTYRDEMASFAAFPVLSNVTGAPAMSVPLFWNDDDLPIGVQFVGRASDEATLFRLAAQLEAAHPWADRRPPPN